MPSAWAATLVAAIGFSAGCTATKVMPPAVADPASTEASSADASAASDPIAAPGRGRSEEQAAADYQFAGWDQDEDSAPPLLQTESAPHESAATRADQAAKQPAATVVSYPVHDPLIRLNRAMFWLNHRAYRYALAPTARLYSQVVPEAARRGIGRFFDNIKVPISLVNNLLQGQFGRAATNLARLSINSTLGVAGVFDPAQSWFNMQPAPAGFAGTLAHWHVGAGPYVVLPLLGPADLRGASGMVGDALLNPIPYLLDQPESTVVVAADSFQDAAPLLPTYEQIYAQAEDPYVFFRNFYVQGRKRNAEFGPGFITGAAFGGGAGSDTAVKPEPGS